MAERKSPLLRTLADTKSTSSTLLGALNAHRFSGWNPLCNHPLNSRQTSTTFVRLYYASSFSMTSTMQTAAPRNPLKRANWISCNRAALEKFELSQRSTSPRFASFRNFIQDNLVFTPTYL